MIGPGTPDLTFCYGIGTKSNPMPNVTFENNMGTKCGGMVTFVNTTGTINSNYYGISCHYVGQPYNNCFAYNGTFQGTFDKWKSATGWDANSINNNTSAAFNSNGSPQSGAPVIGAGANLTNLATGNLATLASDTTLGGTRAAVARPPTGAWDIGAFAYKPASPTGVVVSVQ